jgi:hypothetical protein
MAEGGMRTGKWVGQDLSNRRGKLTGATVQADMEWRLCVPRRDWNAELGFGNVEGSRCGCCSVISSRKAWFGDEGRKYQAAQPG